MLNFSRFREDEAVLAANVVNAPSPPTLDAESIYREHYPLLHFISRQRFKLPENDAENVIHEVFLLFLTQSDEIRSPRSWLIGAISNSCRAYWRSSDRIEPLPSDYDRREDPAHAEIAEKVAIRITVRETLQRLHEKCQTTLRLHYFDGCSAPEVAKKLDTTNRYAEKLIHKCLKRAFEIYSGLIGAKR
jgi:RNA polymerase sigma factor (sigma-70 family)